MKNRIISALAAFSLVIVILFAFNTYILNVFISIILIFSIYEIFVVTKYINLKSLTGLSYTFVVLFPFLPSLENSLLSMSAIMVFSLLLFLILLRNHENETFEQISFVFMIGVLLSVSLSSLIYIREMHPRDAVFYIWLILICSFGADTGAYFFGIFYGKHKLAPKISPKKTIEGALGGVVSVVILVVISSLIYTNIMLNNSINISINYLTIIPVAIVGSVLGILGDLTASIIKRKCSVKDFGDIMPGHGGIVDRIDSLLFVAPFIYFALNIIETIN